MPDNMTVHAYQVFPGENSPPFEDLISDISQRALAARLVEIGKHPMRLETIQGPNTPTNPTRFWLMDFTKLRFEHGPGKANARTAITGFNIANGDGFGEETAALYDPRRQHLIMQYNHHGVRAGSIERYFASFYQDVEYDLVMRMSDDAEQRLANKTVLTKLIFKVAPPKMTAGQRNNGVGLGRVLDLSEHVGAQNIEIIVSAGRERNSQLNNVAARNIINGLRSAANALGIAGASVVEKFEVVGRNGPLEKTEAIDMLAAKWQIEVDQLVLGADLRYTQASRWNGLVRGRAALNNIIGN